MRLSFENLFSIIIKHEVFPQTPASSEGLMIDERTSNLLEIVAEKSTLQLFRQNSLILKKVKNTYQLLYEKKGPRISNLKNLEYKDFYFRISIKDSMLFTCTDTSYLSPSIDQTAFYSPQIDGKLLPEMKKLCGKKFNYTLSTGLRPVKVTVKTFRSEKIKEQIIDRSEIKSLEIDLSNSETGVYSIEENEVTVENMYISDLYQGSQKGNFNFYGVIIIPPNDIYDLLETNKYIIQFKKKKI